MIDRRVRAIAEMTDLALTDAQPKKARWADGRWQTEDQLLDAVMVREDVNVDYV